jgi:hypothetical protein
MAHVTAEVRDSPCGPGVARLDPAGSDVGELLPAFGDLAYPLLRLVDPYGDTFFSTYQMAQVLGELQRLREKTPHPLFDQLVQLAEGCRSRPHRFLVFIGD